MNGTDNYKHFETDPAIGLDNTEAESNLKKYGYNEVA